MMIFMWTLFAINTRLTFFTLWAQVWVLMKCIDVVKVVNFKAAHSHVSGAMILCHAALGDHISPYPSGRVKSKYSSKVGQMKSAYSWYHFIVIASVHMFCSARVTFITPALIAKGGGPCLYLASQNSDFSVDTRSRTNQIKKQLNSKFSDKQIRP